MSFKTLIVYTLGITGCILSRSRRASNRVLQNSHRSFSVRNDEAFNGEAWNDENVTQDVSLDMCMALNCLRCYYVVAKHAFMFQVLWSCQGIRSKRRACSLQRKAMPRGFTSGGGLLEECLQPATRSDASQSHSGAALALKACHQLRIEEYTVGPQSIESL